MSSDYAELAPRKHADYSSDQYQMGQSYGVGESDKCVKGRSKRRSETGSRIARDQTTACNERVPATLDATKLEADSLFENQDFGLALPLYLALASRGDKVAQYRLAMMYESGLGTKPDIAQAYAWISVATEFNSYPLVIYWAQIKQQLKDNEMAKAQSMAYDYYRRFSSTALSSILNKQTTYNESLIDHANRLYMEEKYRRAFKVYLGLAIAGDKFSQYRVSYMYHNGLGIRADYANAYAWAALASELGAPIMVDYFDGLVNEFGENDIGAGKVRLREIYKKSSLLALSKRRVNKLRGSLLQCLKTRVPGPCPELVQTVCQDEEDCVAGPASRQAMEGRNFNTGNIHDAREVKIMCLDSGICVHGRFDYSFSVKLGVNIYRKYEAKLEQVNTFISQYLETYGNVILGEFELIEEESDRGGRVETDDGQGGARISR